MTNASSGPATTGWIWRRGPRVALLAILIAAAAVLIIGNSRSADQPATQAHVPASTPVPEPKNLVYAVMGDSLGRGVQPDPDRTLTGGYAPALRDDFAEQFGKVDFIEAACGGATTTSMIKGGKACSPDEPVPFANSDAATSQLEWGISTLKARQAVPTLITLTIGGNDIAPCIQDDVARLQACVDAAFPTMVRNWKTIASELSAAAGPRTVLAVSTMYNPALGAFKIEQGRWAKSAGAFHKFIVKKMNPELRKVFGENGWVIADMGEAMFERGPLGANTAPVRAICALTAACTNFDIHLNDEGYAVLSDVFRASTEDQVTSIVGNDAGKAPQPAASSS